VFPASPPAVFYTLLVESEFSVLKNAGMSNSCSIGR
jgi:hypothetical protein